MKSLYCLLLLVLNVLIVSAQNIDYNARITRFFAGNCGNDTGINTTEEHTWKGWLSDNVDLSETYSGCVQRNANGSTVQTGNYAQRTRTNIWATSLRARIDAWEDDAGDRCDFNTAAFGGNSDDCRVNVTSNFNFAAPLEFQYKSAEPTVGNGNYNMRVFYEYRYVTTNLVDATDVTGLTFYTGGNRPFWGARGNWAFSGLDCAASGTITHNQTSSFRTTVFCKSAVSFRWRVESEANYDYLRVYVNGVLRASISGTVGWTLVNLPLDYGTNNNTVEWRYEKDGSASIGLDRGFVDQICFTNATSLDPGIIAGDETFNIIGDPTIMLSTVDAQVYSNGLNYQWQYSPNGSTVWSNIGGATSATYDPPAGLTSTRYYRRRTQDLCGNTDYSNVIIKEVLPQFVYDVGVWDPYDPGTTGLPSNSSHSVIVRQNTTQTNSFTTGNLIIDAGVTLTITGDVGVEVINQTELNGILDLGEGGQLIQSMGSNLNVGATGELRKTRQGNTNLYRYTYWGSPVSNPLSASNSGFNINSVLNDGILSMPRSLNFTSDHNGIAGDAITAATISTRWLYAFRNQPGNYSNWEQVSQTTNLLTGQGFTMKGTLTSTGSQPLKFVGTPNNGLINLSITTGNSYLISNPYPSAIDGHQFLLDNPDLGGTLYFWEHYGGDSHVLSEYQGGYATYNFSGGVGAPSIATPDPDVSPTGTPSKIPGRYLPVAQGFFVEATGTGTITFNNNQRTFVPEALGQSVFVKSLSDNSQDPVQLDLRPKLRLGMTGPNNGHRQLLLTVDPAASYDLDIYYDGPTYNVLSNDIAFNINSTHYAIQGIPSIHSEDEIPLIFEISDAGIYSIGIDQLENWGNDQDIFLYDNSTDVYYNLRLSKADINFAEGHYTNQYSLRFSTNSLSVEETRSIDNNLSIYQPVGLHQIVISLHTVNHPIEAITLFDVHGRKVIDQYSNVLSNDDNSWYISTDNLATGTYVLHLQINGILLTRKVVVK